LIGRGIPGKVFIKKETKTWRNDMPISRFILAWIRRIKNCVRVTIP
jgi:hypothetical protein